MPDAHGFHVMNILKEMTPMRMSSGTTCLTVSRSRIVIRPCTAKSVYDACSAYSTNPFTMSGLYDRTPHSFPNCSCRCVSEPMNAAIVVTPPYAAQIENVSILSAKIGCACESMPPGRTYFPVASMTRPAGSAGRSGPTSRTLPSRMSTSARTMPRPEARSPPRTSVSAIVSAIPTPPWRGGG